MTVEFVELQEDSVHEDASPYGSSSSEVGSDDYGGDENHDDNDDEGLQLLELMEGDITHGEAMDPLFLKKSNNTYPTLHVRKKNVLLILSFIPFVGR